MGGFVPAEKSRPGSCSCSVVHPQAVQLAVQAELETGTLIALSELFKVFSDPSRLRILTALSKTELCVCDLTEVLGMNQSAVSHQLAMLRRARLVRFRRDGKSVFYALDDAHIGKILKVALEHVTEGRISL